MATQQERTAEASRLLKSATIDLLFEQGLSRTSTADIARRAGLSRGALTHHFSSREAIIVESVAYQLELACEDLDRFGHEFRKHQGTTDELIDHVWQLMSDRLYYVTLEYLPESRHNPEFKQKLVPVVQKFHNSLDTIWGHFADHMGVERAMAQTWLNATMCVIRGLVAQSILREDPPYFASVLDLWKRQVAADFHNSRDAMPTKGTDKGRSMESRRGHSQDVE
ncbi:hypothetical protein ASD00_31080 [Ensifer sp. Root31]|uniref:TetR/AcrR family transcriptional regulator n=1 Tax=Ensifer sp. Root31 TaxID=1736512 RepID=UPI00070F8014|nr:TetR/AcrR family transcriptional regulator [Ensifer sp. Root31]KQU86342.1 hypothetical protein ASD00_31080 [Ensifer sp. Root31]